MGLQPERGDDLDRTLDAQGKGRVVVGVDGSAPATAALRWAAEMAQGRGWPIDVVTTWEPPISYGWDGIALVGIDWRDDGEKTLTAVVDEVFGAQRPSDLRTFVVEGDPARTLIEHAHGACLLVVGNRGNGGFLGLLLGSVSSKCAAHAPCPVLVVHADDRAPAPANQRCGSLS